MFFSLVTAIFAGFAGAGLVMLLRIGLGNRIPKWATPLAAGGGMLAATVAGEYSWFDTTTAGLPEEFAVVTTLEKHAMWQPWTYWFPYVDRFIAVDMASIRTNEAAQGMRLLNFYEFGRFSAPTEIPALLDCDGNRRAIVIDGVDFDPDGAPVGVTWMEVPAEDLLLRAGCDGDAN